jgi:hypothetical protein
MLYAKIVKPMSFIEIENESLNVGDEWKIKRRGISNFLFNLR